MKPPHKATQRPWRYSEDIKNSSPAGTFYLWAGDPLEPEIIAENLTKEDAALIVTAVNGV